MTTEQRKQIADIINMEKLEKLEKGIEKMEKGIEKMKETIKWYEDYSRVVYQNKPNVDQYACDYADEQQELRNK